MQSQRTRTARPGATRLQVARVATFEDPPVLQADDHRRHHTLQQLLRSLPGFVAGYELREEGTGRLMSVTVWESEATLEAGADAVRNRPVGDQRGIRPTRIERWLVDQSF